MPISVPVRGRMMARRWLMGARSSAAARASRLRPAGCAPQHEGRGSMPRPVSDVGGCHTSLCPAGHLPHKGGDRLGVMVSPNNDGLAWVGRQRGRMIQPLADLHPCGGDGRQARGYPTANPRTAPGRLRLDEATMKWLATMACRLWDIFNLSTNLCIEHSINGRQLLIAVEDSSFFYSGRPSCSMDCL
ncbi:hypothetical protein ACVITL_002494 [Rhizobium pisi]